MVFLQYAIVAFLFQVGAVVLLLVTGSWGYDAPGFLITINPLYKWAAAHGLGPFSHDMLRSFASAEKLATAANIVVWAAVQWISAGALIDVAREKFK
jgi:hypothetical protein